MANIITFMSKDLSKEGMKHNKALHITMMTIGKRVSMVPVDNGLALNVCLFKITTCLGYQQKSFAILGQAIRAYDNSRREVMGISTLEFIARLVPFKGKFQVLYIPMIYEHLATWKAMDSWHRSGPL